MKRIFVGVAVLAVAMAAHAQMSGTNTTNASSNVTTGSDAAAQNAGNAQNITFNSAAQPTDTHQTVANVSAPAMGAYGSGFSSYNCGNTMQGYIAGPGVSAGFGGAKELHSCVLMSMSNELMKQTTVITDTAERAKVVQAAVNVKCMVDEDVYVAMVAAGMNCEVRPRKSGDTDASLVVKPEGKQADAATAQNEAGQQVYAKAQVPEIQH